jgi:hypothetical protein
VSEAQFATGLYQTASNTGTLFDARFSHQKSLESGKLGATSTVVKTSLFGTVGGFLMRSQLTVQTAIIQSGVFIEWSV